jgi:hypothetical protein
MEDSRLTIDVALGWLAWSIIQHGIVRPFAAAFGRRAYNRLDALTGDRLPDLPPS